MTDQTPKPCRPGCHNIGFLWVHQHACPNAPNAPAPVEKPGPDEMDWIYLSLREENAALPRRDLAAYDTVISKLRAEVKRANHDSMTQTRRAIGLEEELILVRGDLSRVLNSLAEAERRKCTPEHHQCACGLISSVWGDGLAARQKEKSK